MKKQIATDNAPQAIGPYSQGMQCGDFYFFSGQIPLDPKTGQMVGETIEAQTTQVLRNIEGLLGSQNLKVTDIVKTTVFLQSMGDFARFNEIYAKTMQAPYPARSTVEVSALPKGALIEIECVVFAPKR